MFKIVCILAFLVYFGFNCGYGASSELECFSSIPKNRTGKIVISATSLKKNGPCLLFLDKKKSAYEVTIINDTGAGIVKFGVERSSYGWLVGDIAFEGVIGVLVDISSDSFATFSLSREDIAEIFPYMENTLKKDALVVELKSNL